MLVITFPRLRPFYKFRPLKPELAEGENDTWGERGMVEYRRPRSQRCPSASNPRMDKWPVRCSSLHHPLGGIC